MSASPESLAKLLDSRFSNKNVWCYWEGSMPPYIRACIASIKQASALSGAKFTLLTPANLKDLDIALPPEFYTLKQPAHRSDVLAALVLSNFGGLFLDADIFFLGTITDLWQRVGGQSGMLFRNAQQQIAVWGLMVTAKHPAMQKWHERQQATLRSKPEEPEWNALGSVLLSEIVEDAQSQHNLCIVDATQTVQPIPWHQQKSYFGALENPPDVSLWQRDWQPFLVLNNHVLPEKIKTATESELIVLNGPMGKLLSKHKNNHRKLIIGLGTGRCGTASFARLLSLNGIDSSHEMSGYLQWQYGAETEAQKCISERLERILSRPAQCVADTAFFYLPHIQFILQYCYERQTDVRFVALKRERQATVNSYVGWVAEKNANHWLSETDVRFTPNAWDSCYPSYAPMPLEEAIGKYWDDYYEQADMLAKRFPDCFSLHNTEALNTLEGVRAIEANISEKLRLPQGIKVHENAYNTPIPVYWINLARSTDRSDFMQRNLKATQLEHHRINAIDGSDERDFNARICFGEDQSFFKRAGFRDRSNAISRSEFGCSASHIYAIAQAYEAGGPYALICEDDVVLEQDILNKISFVLARLPKDCSILQLVTIGPPETIRLLYSEYVNKGRNVIRRQELLERLSSLGEEITPECQGTQAYIITRRGMCNILSQFWRENKVFFPAPEKTQEGNFGMVADELLYKFSEGKNEETWVLTRPFACWQNFGSEIHPEHTSEHERALREVHSVQQRTQQLTQWPVTTYWINREVSQERRQRMAARLERAGLNHVRVSAVDGDNLDELVNNIRFNEKVHLPDEPRGEAISNRELACTASHYKAIYQAWCDGSEIALILEDDVEVGLISREWLDAILKHLPRDCGVLQLSVVPERTIPRLVNWSAVTSQAFIKKQDLISIRPDSANLKDITLHGASAYLIKRNAMRNVLQASDDIHQLCLPPISAIRHNAAVLADRLIYRNAAANGLHSYAMCHPILTWETLDSELHPAHLDEHIASKNTALRCILKVKNPPRTQWLKIL